MNSNWYKSETRSHPMETHCNQKTFEFQTINTRKIVAHFNGGNISSDAGSPLRPPGNDKGVLRMTRLLMGLSIKHLKPIPDSDRSV